MGSQGSQRAEKVLFSMVRADPEENYIWQKARPDPQDNFVRDL